MKNKEIIVLIVIIIIAVILQKLPSPYKKIDEGKESKINKDEFISQCIDKYDFERVKCIALATENVALCDNLKVDDESKKTQRENCRFRYFMTHAILENDESHCNNLEGDRIAICKLTVTRNPSFCSLLNDSPKDKCIEFISSPIIPLKNTPTTSLDENSLNFYTNIAIKEKKPELCELWQIYRKVRKCKVIADPNLKTVEFCNQDVKMQCEDEYILKTAETEEECNSIQFLQKKEECINSITK